MSNRQERIARKARQRAGVDAYVHLKPTGRSFTPAGTAFARRARRDPQRYDLRTKA